MAESEEDGQGTASPVLLRDGEVAVVISAENLRAFQEWERLSAEEKKGLVKIAKRWKTVMDIVRMWDGLSWLTKSVISVGILAGAITGILMAWRTVQGL